MTRLVWSAGTGQEAWELFCACADGDLPAVTRIIDHNPALIRAHYEYRTPLYFAVPENHIAIATFLLERGAEPFWNGNDLVQMAQIRGLSEMHALIERQRSRFPKRHGPVDSPLVAAARRGQLDVVRSLLEAGADPNEPEERNAPHGRALYSAVYDRHYEAAKLLLEHGANSNQEVESSADAPSIAIMNSDTKIIQLLAAHGAVWSIPVAIAEDHTAVTASHGGNGVISHGGNGDNGDESATSVAGHSAAFSCAEWPAAGVAISCPVNPVRPV